MTQVSPSNFKTLSPQYDADYSNGLFIEEASGDLVTLKDSVVIERHDRALFCRVFEDFLGSTAVPASADTAQGPWLVKDTSAAGSPTLAVSADADCGAFEMKFSNTDEAQILTLYWGDEQNIDPAKSPSVTFRMKLVTNITNANDILVFGLASAQNDTADSVASMAWFRLETASGNLLVETDNGTTDTNDKDTGVDIAADTWYEFKVDLPTYGAAKFYYRTTLGDAWTDITPAATTFAVHSTTNLQPFVQLQKSGGTHTTDLLIDYVDVSWLRV